MGYKGNEVTHVSWLGTLYYIPLPLVVDYVTQGSQRSIADLGWVAKGPSGTAYHEREEALTPISPQWPLRTLGISSMVMHP